MTYTATATDLHRMASDTLAHDGGTYVPGAWTSANLPDGFMVGGIVRPSDSVAPNADDVADALARFLARDDVRDALAGHYGYRAARFVGTWADAAGRIVIDVSERYADMSDALHVGAHRGEDAVWDCAAAASVQVPDAPDTADATGADATVYAVTTYADGVATDARMVTGAYRVGEVAQVLARDAGIPLQVGDVARIAREMRGHYAATGGTFAHVAYRWQGITVQARRSPDAWQVWERGDTLPAPTPGAPDPEPHTDYPITLADADGNVIDHAGNVDSAVSVLYGDMSDHDGRARVILLPDGFTDYGRNVADAMRAHAAENADCFGIPLDVVVIRPPAIASAPMRFAFAVAWRDADNVADTFADVDGSPFDDVTDALQDMHADCDTLDMRAGLDDVAGLARYAAGHGDAVTYADAVHVTGQRIAYRLTRLALDGDGEPLPVGAEPHPSGSGYTSGGITYPGSDWSLYRARRASGAHLSTFRARNDTWAHVHADGVAAYHRTPVVVERVTSDVPGAPGKVIDAPVYRVTYNAPGYLPETDPVHFDTYADAVAYVAGEHGDTSPANVARDAGAADPSGNGFAWHVEPLDASDAFALLADATPGMDSCDGSSAYHADNVDENYTTGAYSRMSWHLLEPSHPGTDVGTWQVRTIAERYTPCDAAGDMNRPVGDPDMERHESATCACHAPETDAGETSLVDMLDAMANGLPLSVPVSW